MNKTAFVGLLMGCFACGTEAAVVEEAPVERHDALSVSYKNPVYDGDFADPAVLPVDDGYYAYATNGAGRNVQAMHSPDLVHWERLPDALPTLPSWAKPGLTWAPVVSKLAGSAGYLMYFTARDRESGKQCIGYAHSANAAGPFVSHSHVPLVCPVAQGGAIDPSAFVDADGSRYIVWKNDGNCCGHPDWLHVQPTSSDGTVLTGPAVQLVRNDQPWEGAVVEAPVIHRHHNTYYLFYSANNYANGSYTIGYATSSHLQGPYTKFGSWVASSTAHGPVIGPGGQDIVLTHTGHLALVYHSWAPNMGTRHLNVVPITWSHQDKISATASYGETVSLP